MKKGDWTCKLDERVEEVSSVVARMLALLIVFLSSFSLYVCLYQQRLSSLGVFPHPPRTCSNEVQVHRRFHLSAALPLFLTPRMKKEDKPQVGIKRKKKIKKLRRV